MKDKIREIILNEGADVCGIVGEERFSEFPKGYSPLDSYKGCRSAVVFGIALPKGLYEVAPRIIYGSMNEKSSAYCDRISFFAAKKIEKAFSCSAVPFPSDGPYEYWDKETMTGLGNIPMKDAAFLAGLGQFGKSSLLINPEYGTRLTLGIILTDLPLPSDPLSENICIDGCTKCLDACPVHAIADKHVNQALCRTNTYCKTERGFGTVECNRCRTVCPMRYGKSAKKVEN